MKLRTINDDRSRGLARWGWIKKYLKPALSFAGISSDDFDKIAFGNDQIIRTQKTPDTPFPTPDIEINGATYTPTGEPPAIGEPTFNGYWCIAFTWSAVSEVFDTDPSPDVSRFAGSIAITEGPAFVFSDLTNATHTVNLSTGASNTGSTIIPLAYFLDGDLIIFFNNPTLYFFTQGGNFVNAYAQ